MSKRTPPEWVSWLVATAIISLVQMGIYAILVTFGVPALVATLVLIVSSSYVMLAVSQGK